MILLGLEPKAYTLKVYCSTNWATGSKIKAVDRIDYLHEVFPLSALGYQLSLWLSFPLLTNHCVYSSILTHLRGCCQRLIPPPLLFVGNVGFEPTTFPAMDPDALTTELIPETVGLFALIDYGLNKPSSLFCTPTGNWTHVFQNENLVSWPLDDGSWIK